MTSNTELNLNKRLVSLDAFRGLTIAGMILVNDPGSWDYVFDPLEHAAWNGITPTDLVFPFFVFIMGVSVTLVYSKQLAKGAARGALINKLLVRSLMIFGFGIFLSIHPQFYSFSPNPYWGLLERIGLIATVYIGLIIWKSNYDFKSQSRQFKLILWSLFGIGAAMSLYRFEGFSLDELRIVGVLQRIALVYLFCSLLYIYWPAWQKHAWTAIVLLLGYWAMMTLIPTPGEGKVMLEPGKNLAAWLDNLLVPGKLYQGTWDPEGFLSTLPSIATGISGMLVGTLIISEQTTERKLIWMLALGFLAFLVGGIWDWFFPINKNLWTSSFVMYTSGAAAMGLATSIWLVDVLGYKRGTRMGVIFGSNALSAYMLHSMINDIFFINFGSSDQYMSINSLYFNGLLTTGLSPEFVSLIWAILYVLICYVPMVWLYKRQIFIKV